MKKSGQIALLSFLTSQPKAAQHIYDDNDNNNNNKNKKNSNNNNIVSIYIWYTLPETSLPLKIGQAPKGHFIFQPFIFRGKLAVSFQGWYIKPDSQEPSPPKNLTHPIIRRHSLVMRKLHGKHRGAIWPQNCLPGVKMMKGTKKKNSWKQTSLLEILDFEGNMNNV